MTETCSTVKNTPEDQKASCNSVPASTASHNHPDMHPVAGKCMQGANIK
jgi:hypothetical protein